MLAKEILEVRWKAIIGFLVFTTMAMGAPFLFWYMENNAEMKAQFEALPPEMVGRLSDYQSLVHSNWFGQNLLEAGIVLAAILGSTAIAGEVSKRTMEFLLSKPIGRFEVLMTKIAVGVVALGIVVIASSVVLYPVSVILGFDISLVSLLLASILGWLGINVMFALSVLFSTFFDDILKPIVATLVVALLLTIPGFFASSARFSIYNHMQDFSSFMQGTIPLADVALLLALFVILVGACYMRFKAEEF